MDALCTHEFLASMSAYASGPYAYDEGIRKGQLKNEKPYAYAQYTHHFKLHMLSARRKVRANALVYEYC